MVAHTTLLEISCTGSLMNIYSAFDLEREREWRQKENALKVQIAQLEATLKADLGEKGGILDKLAIEKGNSFGFGSEINKKGIMNLLPPFTLRHQMRDTAIILQSNHVLKTLK